MNDQKGKIMLESQGYFVPAAGSPSEAIHLAKEHTGNIHLLITDVVMPQMNGRDLAKKLISPRILNACSHRAIRPTSLPTVASWMKGSISFSSPFQGRIWLSR
jgi:CheY-like chemotaxis protein